MIQIYKPENNKFDKNGDATLSPISCESTVILNGSWEMELIIPATTELVSLVTENSVIKAPSPEFDNDQLWRIYAVDKDNDEIVAQAYPIFLDAKNDCFLTDVRPTGKTGQEALNIMCAANSKYTATTDITKSSTAYYIRKNLIEAIGSDDEQSFINRWGGEVLYNNFAAVINERAGGDYGARAELGFNIQGIEEKIDMSEVATRIIPESYNGYTLSGDKPWVDSPIINAYPTAFARVIQYSNIKLREDAQENDEENGSIICDTLEELRAALAKAAQQEYENGIDEPHVEYKIDILDLESTREYRNFKSLVKIRLGDVVHVRHRRLGIDIEVRCIGRKYDHAAKRITEITLGNPENNYFDDVSNTIDRIGEVIDPDSGMLMAERVKGILDAVSTQLRLQSTVAKKINGRAFEISDLDPESELYGCMIFGSQGLQIATERTADGRDWNWRTAITAKGVVADAIITGLLSDKTGRNYWNLDTGEFRMTMEAFTVDGKTVEDIAKGAAGDAQDLAEAYADRKLAEFTTTVTGNMDNLQKQIDGQIETFYYDHEPNLNNLPASEWTTEIERAKHEGDLFYWKSKGYAYRFFKNNDIWMWQLVQDTDVTKALANAQKAQETADSKQRSFTEQPYTPYDVGDTWSDGKDILTCIVKRQTGAFQKSDWRKLNAYTDDSALNDFLTGDYKETISEIRTQADNKAEIWRQKEDPAANWGQEEKAVHKGDLWYNTSDQEAYIYTGAAWEIMKAVPPDEIFDLIEGKMQLFSPIPVTPYNVGDLWMTGTVIKVCVQARDTGEYVESDWEKKDNYTDDSYAKQVEGIVEALGDDLYQQLDGKIESYSQSDDPSSAWTQDIQKQQHTGDIWYNTDTKTTKRWSGTVWEELANGKADAAAELAKAKCKVYINQPVPPYRICDLWVQGDIGDIMVSSVTRETGSFVASDWRKASNYSESAYYFLESNINHLEISRADGYIYPSVFTLSAFKQKNGTPPSRGAYKGKIQVYGVYNDGESTTTIYKTTSGTTESTVDIQTSGLDEYTEIRCELWSDVDTEGYIHRLQVIHIPVGRDPLTLNWEETFDMLTNNGKIQGLFAENGQIYINASFIRSGELILGGLNNQYGTFKLKDANDNDIGIWDKQGMTLTNSKGDYRIMFNTSFGTFDNVISVEKKVSGTNVPIAFMKTTGYIGTYNPTNKLGCGMAAGEVNFTYRSSASGNDAAIGYIAGSRSGTENALAIQSYGVLQLLSQKLVIVDTDPWKAYEGGSGVIKVITQDSSGKQWITTLTYLNGIMVTNLS